MKPTSLRRKAHTPTETELRHTTNVTTSSLKELGGKGKRAKPSTVTTQYNEAWDDIAAVARRQSLKKKLLEKEQRASIKQIRVKGVEVSRPLALLTTCDELTDAELRALVDQAHGRVIARDDDIVNAATIKEMLRLPEPPALRPGLINIIVLCVLVRVFGSDPLSGITLRRVDAAAGFNLKVVEDDVTIRRLDGSFVATIIRGAGRWASESLFVGLGSVIERIEATKRTKRELKEGVGPRATACKAYTVAGFVAHERTPHKPGSEKKVLAPRALNMSPEREILNRELAHKLAFVYSRVREFVYSEVRPHEIAMNKLMGIRFFDGHFKPAEDAPFVAAAYGEHVAAIEHVDRDVSLGMLVVVDVDDEAHVLDGNGFAFGDVGTYVALGHGDVLLFNPKERHAITESFYKTTPPTGTNPRRYVISLYLKQKHLKNTACRPPTEGVRPMTP